MGCNGFQYFTKRLSEYMIGIVKSNNHLTGDDKKIYKQTKRER